MTVCMIAHTFSLAYGKSGVVSQSDNRGRKKGSWVAKPARV